MPQSVNATCQAIFTANFNCLLEEKLKKEKLSKKQFSRIYGFSDSTLSLWCNGGRFPGDENLDKLCQCLGVPLADFFVNPYQSDNPDQPSKANGKMETVIPSAGNDLSTAALKDSITSLLAKGTFDFTVNILTDRLAPAVQPNDVLSCTNPATVSDNDTALCIIWNQLCLCKVQKAGPKLCFTNLNAKEQVVQLESEAARNAILCGVALLTRSF